MASCRDCDQPVTWAVITRRDGETSRLPVDPRPIGTGNVAALKDVHGTLHGRVLGKNDQPRPGEHTYMPHKATCTATPRTTPPTPPPAADDTYQTELF